MDDRTRQLEFRWPRRRYRILERLEGPWAAAWGKLPRRYVPFLPNGYHWVPPASPEDVGGYRVLPAVEPPGEPWEFEALERRSSYQWAPSPAFRLSWPGQEEAETVRIFRIRWPVGGIFVPDPERPAETFYEPLLVAGKILIDAHRTQGDDPVALLEFVNRWGVLGVGIPGADAFPADGVLRTGDYLGQLTRCLKAAEALCSTRLGSPMTWQELAAFLDRELAGVSLRTRVTPKGLAAAVEGFTLKQALFYMIRHWATGGSEFRRCPECHVVFLSGRTNQEYCSRACGGRRRVRKWRRHRQEVRGGSRVQATKAPHAEENASRNRRRGRRERWR